MPDFLPVIGSTDQLVGPPSPAIAEAVAALADTIASESADPTNVRFGSVTSLADPNNVGRVRIDIAGDTWCSRSRDVSLAVGDRVCALQQGGVMMVVARLDGGEATPIGSMIAFAGVNAPTGWALCNGAAVSRVTYAALFAVIGTGYGVGDGSTTFNLPDMRDRSALGSGGSYTRGTTGGSKTVTLTADQMPGHSHGSNTSVGSDFGHSHSTSVSSDYGHSHSASGATSGPGGTGSGGAYPTMTSTGTAGGHSHSVTIGTAGSHSHSVSISINNTGGGGSHENMPPYLAVPYIIRTQ
jgi:microcystin-dependent protein